MRVIGTIETKVGKSKRERSVMLGLFPDEDTAIKRGARHLREITTKGLGAGFKVVDNETGETKVNYKVNSPEPVIIMPDEIDFIELGKYDGT